MKRKTGLQNIKGHATMALAFAMVLCATSAQAANVAMNRATNRPLAPTKDWSIPFSFETASTLQKQGAYEREAQTSLAVAPSIKLLKNLKLSTAITVWQEHTGAENSGFDNTPVSLALRTEITPSTAWTNSIGGILPTNRQMQDETSYQGAVKGETALTFDNLFLGSSLRYGISYTRNVHEFKQAADGSFNMQQTVSQKIDYSLPLAKTVSLDTSFAYSYGWTYLQDSRTKFYAGADISWAFMKDWSASVGTSNEGSALKPNGTDSNIEFYNDNTSVVKFGLTYVL